MVILGSYWILEIGSSSFIQLTEGVGEPENINFHVLKTVQCLENDLDKNTGLVLNYTVN